ncbi:roadblock/LC7 domain-containing protein [Demequina lignilytica]|uniref:Roadblock/LC7 domain-containing protein n=1 Tax=Demequina lignilytica TaxID=3051663 RepID=A0AB35MFJ3_9MICO|nr:roadblock/LC7 domain-containing protein [Demequina sp. SYSU T0a273]MDN4482508.1 roadblock/LC7 domain-containing protein [Demequina sp. SYSU T0a273]
MIIPKHGLLASAQIKRAVPGVTRVLLARTDGIAVYDDATLADRDTGAAVSATLIGLATSAAGALRLGRLDAVTLHTSAGLVVVQPIDSAHVLAAIAHEDIDVARLREVVGEAVLPLLGRWRVGVGA